MLNVLFILLHMLLYFTQFVFTQMNHSNGQLSGEWPHQHGCQCSIHCVKVTSTPVMLGSSAFRRGKQLHVHLEHCKTSAQAKTKHSHHQSYVIYYCKTYISFQHSPILFAFVAQWLRLASWSLVPFPAVPTFLKIIFS